MEGWAKLGSGTEGKARPSDLECFSSGSKGHGASVGGADVKVPWGGIVHQNISLLAPPVQKQLLGVFGTEGGIQISVGKFLKEDVNAFSWEGKHMAPVLEVQLRSCPLEVKGSNFPSWYIWCGSTASIRTIMKSLSIF